MKNPMTVLVVEDNPKHLADLVEMLHVELPRLPIKLDLLYAKTLAEAAGLLEKADVIMTDVFFPAMENGDANEANGKLVVQKCLEATKPVVWVTSTYHHGAKTQDVSEWGLEHGLEMFDCSSAATGRDGEAPHKPWKDALYGLMYLALAMEQGYVTVKDGRIFQKKGYRGSAKPHQVKKFFEGPNDDDFIFTKMIEIGFPRG